MSIRIGTSLSNVDINSNGKESYKHSSLYNVGDYYTSSSIVSSGVLSFGYFNGAKALASGDLFSAWVNIGTKPVLTFRQVAQGNGRLISGNYLQSTSKGAIITYDSRFGGTSKGVIRNAVESTTEPAGYVISNYSGLFYGWGVAVGNNQIYVIHEGYTTSNHDGRYVVYPLDPSQLNGSTGPRIGFVSSANHGTFSLVGEIGNTGAASQEVYIKAGQDRILTGRQVNNGRCVVTNTLGIMITYTLDTYCMSYAVSNGNMYFGYSSNSNYGNSFVTTNSEGYFTICDLYGARKCENITYNTAASVTNYAAMTSGCGIIAISHTGWTYDTGTNRGKVSLFTANGEFIKDIYDIYVHQSNAYYGRTVIIKNNLIFVLAPGYKALSTTAQAGKFYIYNLNGDLITSFTPGDLGWSFSNFDAITCDGDDLYIHGGGSGTYAAITFMIHFKITSSFSHYYDKLIENYRY